MSDNERHDISYFPAFTCQADVHIKLATPDTIHFLGDLSNLDMPLNRCNRGSVLRQRSAWIARLLFLRC